jgi:uncharacterized protein
MRGFFRLNSIVLRLLASALAILPIALGATGARAERVEDLPKPTDYVSDYAHVLSPQAVARLDRICTQLDRSKADAQIAIVTVHTLNGDDSADYATRLFEKMKIGSKATDRGVLLLLAIDDRRRSIKVGYGLGGILPDARTGDIGRSMNPYLKAGDYDSAVLLAVSQLGQTIAADAKVSLDDEPAGSGAVRIVPPVRHGPSLAKIVLLIVVLIFFGGFHLLRFLLGFGLLGSFFGGRGPWIGGGGFGGGGFGGGGGGDGGGSGFGGFGGGGTDGGGSDGSW